MQRITSAFYEAVSPRLLARSRLKCTKAPKETPLRRLLDDASSFGESEVEAAEPEMRWATQPYPARIKGRPDPVQPRVDPRETTVLLFPGQGSQQVGMGRALQNFPAAKQLYELASNIVG